MHSYNHKTFLGSHQARGFRPSPRGNARLVVKVPEFSSYFSLDGIHGEMRRFSKKVGDRVDADEGFGEVETLKISHLLRLGP